MAPFKRTAWRMIAERERKRRLPTWSEQIVASIEEMGRALDAGSISRTTTQLKTGDVVAYAGDDAVMMAEGWDEITALGVCHVLVGIGGQLTSGEQTEISWAAIAAKVAVVMVPDGVGGVPVVRKMIAERRREESAYIVSRFYSPSIEAT